MAVRLAREFIKRMLQSDIVPGRGCAMALLAAELEQNLGLDVSIENLPDLQHYSYVD